MWKSEQPPDAVLSPTWSLTDVCGSLDIIARSSPQEDHHRAVAAVIRGLPPDWKRPPGRPSLTWLRAVEADLGQQTLALHLPGGRQLFVTTGGALGTQQRSSGVCYKRKKEEDLYVRSHSLANSDHTQHGNPCGRGLYLKVSSTPPSKGSRLQRCPILEYPSTAHTL